MIKIENIKYIFFPEKPPKFVRVDTTNGVTYEGYFKQETIDKLLSQTNIPQFT